MRREGLLLGMSRGLAVSSQDQSLILGLASLLALLLWRRGRLWRRSDWACGPLQPRPMLFLILHYPPRTEGLHCAA
jgi:hypothetical protein